MQGNVTNLSEQHAMVHLLTFIILFCLLSVQRWSGQNQDQNLALVREVLITEPYRFKARSRTTESEKVWQQVADNLNSDHTLKFPSKKFVFFFRETGVIAGSTTFSSNKRSLRYQSRKTSRVFLKDVMELKHESITLSSLVKTVHFFPLNYRVPDLKLHFGNDAR